VNPTKHKGLGFVLEREFSAKTMVRSRVDESNSIIVVLDLPELPADAERIVRRNIPAWLKFSVWTYPSLRDIARDPNSPLESLLTAAHVLPKSVETNPIFEWIALENPGLAQRLRTLL
jgi:hypothetical protein